MSYLAASVDSITDNEFSPRRSHEVDRVYLTLFKATFLFNCIIS